MAQKRVAITTLGCKVNQYESAALEELFRRSGYSVVEFDELADVYVINTCTVTHLGDRKSRQLIRRAARNNPEALVTVTGCYAQTAPDEVLNVEGVDLVVGSGSRKDIVELVENAVKGGKLKAVGDIAGCREFEELPGEAHQGRVRAFIKIQEGCENFCAYCIVPFARGPLRSRSSKNILTAVRELVDRGFKEFVLTGINTGTYGREQGNDNGLVRLLEKMAYVPGLVRLRLSSVEPNYVTPELMMLFSSGQPFCRHLHIPLQSGDDGILKSMGRRYDTLFFKKLVEKARENIPGVGITTDIMVGFPGESEQQFINSCSFVDEIKFSGLHVFKYSPRKGTPAANFPDQIRPEVKDDRSRILIALGKGLTRSFATGFIGEKVEVLVEQAEPTKTGHVLEGLTDNYVRVFFEGAPDHLGKLAAVEITGLNGTGLKGRII